MSHQGRPIRRSLPAVVLAAVLVAGIAPSTAAISVKWHAKQGRSITDTASRPDGSIYASGFQRHKISTAATLQRFAPDGTRQWQQLWLPNPEAATRGVSVAVGDDGTVYLLGIVQGECEGGGWFVRAYRPNGHLRWKYVTPGWACSINELPEEIAVRGNLVVVAGSEIGCCDDPAHDGFIRGFSRTLRPQWRADVEPPSTPTGYFDTATGVAIGSGGVFVAGWAGTTAATGAHPGSPMPGSPIIERFTTGGHRVWSRRVGMPLSNPSLTQSVAVGPNSLVISSPIRGMDVAWGSSPTAAFLGSYSLAGAPRWWRWWGGTPTSAIAPTGIDINPAGKIWVATTRRNIHNHGTSAEIRLYSAGGTMLQGRLLPVTERYVNTGGIVSAPAGAAVAGWVGKNSYLPVSGHLWRLLG